MNDIDRWTAEQCGVIKLPNDITLSTPYHFIVNSNHYFHEWTIEDARVREIVREKFKINTSYIDIDKWRSVEMKWRRKYPDDTGSYCLSGKGKTIAEAEINCIKAIYEASNGN